MPENPKPFDLEAVRANAQHVRSRGTAAGYGTIAKLTHDAEAMAAEIERVTKRLNDAHEALTRVEDDDPDEFVSLESTVEWVVTHYRALKRDFDELHDMLGTDGARVSSAEPGE